MMNLKKSDVLKMLEYYKSIAYSDRLKKELDYAIKHVGGGLN
jgi:hypothetical protein